MQSKRILCATLLHFVRRDLQLVAVGIAEINRVRNFVVLEFEFDSALLQFPLRSTKIFAIRAKRQMKHSNFAMRRRFRLLVRGEQGDPGISFANKSRHSVPHTFMKSLEPEDVDVPFGRSFDVAHAHGYVINAFELHGMLDRMYRIYGIAETINVERVVLNALTIDVALPPNICAFCDSSPSASGKVDLPYELTALS